MSLADKNGRRPIDSAWEQILSKSISTNDAEIVAGIYNGDYLGTQRFTSLHRAVLELSASPNLTELLCTSKGSVDMVDASGRTCLSWAATRKNHEHIRLLLSVNADPCILDFEGNPPLFHAVRASDLEGVKTLIDHGADLRRRDVFGGVILHSACQARESPELVEFLVSAGLSVNTVDADGNPPLFYAAWRDFPANLTKLLDLGADTTLSDFAGDRAINVAINHGAERAVTALLERRVGLTHLNGRRRTILHSAALAPRLTIFKLLAAANLRGVDPEAVDLECKRCHDYFYEKADIEDTPLWEAFRMLVKAAKEQNEQRNPLMPGNVHLTEETGSI